MVREQSVMMIVVERLTTLRDTLHHIQRGSISTKLGLEIAREQVRYVLDGVTKTTELDEAFRPFFCSMREYLGQAGFGACGDLSPSVQQGLLSEALRCLYAFWDAVEGADPRDRVRLH
jgi:hypothetical protein